MALRRWVERISGPFINLVVFLAALLFAVLLWWSGNRQAGTPPFLFWLFASAGAVAVTWFVGFLRYQARKQRAVEQQVSTMQRELNGAMQLNQLLLDAEDEEQLIGRALAIFSELSGAVGSSFMPLDEWGQPLQAITHGKLPPSVLSGWAEHLMDRTIRQECRACQQLNAPAGTPCPLMISPLGQPYDIYCLPVWHGERQVGMLNLYLPSGQVLSEELRTFIEGLLGELTLAIESIRLRRQELTTLRQLQLARGAQVDLANLLGNLMDGLFDALDLDGVYLEARGYGQSKEGIRLVRGKLAWLSSDEPHALCERIYQNPRLADQLTAIDGFKRLVAAPMRLPEGHVVGVLLAGSTREAAFHARQMALIYTVAAQAALLLENERNRANLELRSVLQERIRLAREIHDGLAQTLAFLKLNAAQMQSYLARQDLQRLEQAIRESYETLTEAYLDTRQVIDNLRLSPEKGMLSWMERTCTDFQEVTGMQVDRQCEPVRQEVLPEIQSQLMRIVQEALTNIRKHSGARHVRVSLLSRQGDLVLEMADDGRGFLPEEVPSPARHGLLGMQERAELIGADFQIISQPGQGTTVRLRLPLQAEELQR
jgi:two-component system nitrate/nitrite sensor histidine kinase NarX